MKKPVSVSFTMLCAPNPSATPAIPALAKNGPSGTSRLSSTISTAIVQTIARAVADRAPVSVAIRWRLSSWVRFGVPSSLRRNRATAILTAIVMMRAVASVTRTERPQSSNHDWSTPVCPSMPSI